MFCGHWALGWSGPVSESSCHAPNMKWFALRLCAFPSDPKHLSSGKQEWGRGGSNEALLGLCARPKQVENTMLNPCPSFAAS